MTQKPPYPERLIEQKIKNPISFLELDIVEELHNACVKIPSLQSIKEIPIYKKNKNKGIMD